MEFGFTEIVIVAVILSRLLVPLLIIRFPLPAIVACLIIDAVDQTVFTAVAPDADLSGYQTYDKALDIYYLVIAYISTLRNWTNRFALEVARFLIYYRLVGRGALRAQRASARSCSSSPTPSSTSSSSTSRCVSSGIRDA